MWLTTSHVKTNTPMRAQMGAHTFAAYMTWELSKKMTTHWSENSNVVLCSTCCFWRKIEPTVFVKSSPFDFISGVWMDSENEQSCWCLMKSANMSCFVWITAQQWWLFCHLKRKHNTCQSDHHTIAQHEAKLKQPNRSTEEPQKSQIWLEHYSLWLYCMFQQ